MKNAKTLTEGPLAKQILLVSLPLALSNLLQVLFNMSDVAVVGRFAGSTALGAVGSTSIFVTLFTGFLIGLSNGINVLVARFYGAKHPGDVKKTVHSALIISFIAGVILLFVGLLGSPALLELLNTKPDLLPGAILYLRVYFLGMPALALYNFGNAVFSAIGDTKKPLVYLSIAGALNIVLNLFFVIVCQLNVMGVALALVRIDVKSWIRKVTVVGITQKIESVLAFTAVKSSVDVDKISFNTFMEAYKYQLQRDAAHALNENDLMKEIKRAKEVYNLLKTDSAESTLVFDTLKLPGQNIHPAFIH